MASKTPEPWESFEMPFKHELERWSQACEAYDRQDYQTALEIFHSLPESSRIDLNIGLIFADIGDHASAINAYSRSTSMDKYFAVAYYQMGVSHFMLGEWDDAINAFDCAYKNLRGNEMIDYTQLGLTYKLYACEVIFNRGMSHLNAVEMNAGLEDLYLAKKKRLTPEHDIIEDALRACGEGYSVYSIPPGVLYRPPPFKLRNMIMFDYFATTKVIDPMAPIDDSRDYTLDPSIKEKMADATRRRAKDEKGRGKEDKLRGKEDKLRGKDDKSRVPETRKKTVHQNIPASPFINPRPAPKPTTYTVSLHALPPKRPTSDDVVPQKSQSTKANSSAQQSNPQYARKYSDPAAIVNRPGHNRSHSRGGAITDPESPASSHPSTTSSSAFSHRHDAPNDWVSPASSASSSSRSSKVLDTSPQIPAGRAYPPVKTTRQGSRDSERTITPGNGFEPHTPIITEDSEMIGKIKLKAHLNDETRILLFPQDTKIQEIFRRVQEKFHVDYALKIKYRDEDGELVGIVDEEDWKVARVVSRLYEKARNRNPNSNGGERVEVWCS